MVNKETAKNVAVKEVLKRIVTLEQAKEGYKKWITDGLSSGSFDQHTLDFWEEVCRQVDEVVIPN